MSIESFYERFSKTKFSVEQLCFLYKIGSFDGVRKITWDLDQILSDSEVPVKAAYDWVKGTNFRYDPIKRWHDLAHRSHEEFGDDLVVAKQFETRLWTSPGVLNMANPYPEIQLISQIAANKSIEQHVVTGRISGLRSATYYWLQRHFGWIDYVWIRSHRDDRDASTYKAETVRQINPDVHFEDSHTDTLAVLIAGIPVVHFPRVDEVGLIEPTDNLYEFPSRQMYYDLFAIYNP